MDWNDFHSVFVETMGQLNHYLSGSGTPSESRNSLPSQLMISIYIIRSALLDCIPIDMVPLV